MCHRLFPNPGTEWHRFATSAPTSINARLITRAPTGGHKPRSRIWSGNYATFAEELDHLANEIASDHTDFLRSEDSPLEQSGFEL
jgi:hypothetical protein